MTVVSVEKSRTEIERTLKRYGAKEFAFALSDDKAMIQFQMGKLLIRFTIPLFNLNERERMQRWRVLALAVKAKLEMVESKVTTIEDEFLSHIVTPDGRTFGELMVPKLKQAVTDGTMPLGLLEYRP